jgi:hypothetical protein
MGVVKITSGPDIQNREAVGYTKPENNGTLHAAELWNAISQNTTLFSIVIHRHVACTQFDCYIASHRRNSD